VDDHDDIALLAGIPRRHLASAAWTCAAHGRVVLPAGRPGDLERAVAGTVVLLMISGEDEVPAATWRATFVERVNPEESDELRPLIPSSWVEERLAHASASEDDDPDPMDDEEEAADLQSFFEVERLEELRKHEWVFANEVVRKQERGGRSFLPRGPRLIRLPI